MVVSANAQSTTRGVTTWHADENYVTNIQNQLNALNASIGVKCGSGQILMGGASANVCVTPSGDITISPTGVTTLVRSTGTLTNGTNTLNNFSVNGQINVKAFGALCNGTGDDAPAIQAAIEASRSATLNNTSSQEVHVPAGICRTLAPIILRSSLTAGTKNPAFVGDDGYAQSWIDAEFVGPAIIAAASVTYPTDRNLNLTPNIIPGGSGNSLTATANMFSPFNLAEVVGFNTSAFPATGAFNGLGQWDIRMFMRDDDTAAAHCMWASDGGLNLILAQGLNSAGFNANTGAMGYLCVGADAKLYGSLNVNGAEIRVNSGATTVTQGLVYEVELNLDSAHNVNLFMGTGVTVTRVAQSASGGTTIKQRGDENDYLLADAPVWPTPSGALPWRGAVQSVQISNIARNTGASYTADTAQFANDANTRFLMNNGLVNFPNGAPYIQVDKGTGAGPWFMAQSDFNSGCCGGQQVIKNIAIEGTATIGIFGDSSVIDVERPVVAIGDPSIAGIMTTTNATNGSMVRGAPTYGTLSATLAPLWMTGGITAVENMSLNASSYPMIVQQGGVVSNIFYQTNTRTVCAVVDVGGGLTFRAVNADSENGGDFPWFCGQNLIQPVTIDAGTVSDGSIAALSSPFTFYGAMGKFTIKDSEIFFPSGEIPSSNSVIDATYGHSFGGGHPQVANCSGVGACPHITFDHDLFYIGSGGNQPSDIPPAPIAFTNNGVPYDVVSLRNMHSDLEMPTLSQLTGFASGGNCASPCNVAIPAGAAQGQVAVVAFNFTSAVLPVITTPAGWTAGCALDDHVASFTNFVTYWKALGPSDIGVNATFSWAGGTTPGFTLAINSALNQLNPVGTCHTATGGAATSFSATGGANIDINSRVLVFAAPQAQTATPTSPPTDFIKISGSEWTYLPRSLTEPAITFTTTPAAAWSSLQMELLPDVKQTALMPFNAGSPPCWYGESGCFMRGLLWTHAGSAFQTITSTANATPVDASKGDNCFENLVENTTIGVPSNPLDGQVLTFLFTNDATPRVVSWNAIFHFVGAAAPTITASKDSTVSFKYNLAKNQWNEISRALNE